MSTDSRSSTSDGSTSSDGGDADSGSTSAASDAIVGDEGHFDFDPAVQDGAFTVLVKDDRTAPPVWRDPASVVFHLGDAAFHAADTVPDDLDFVAGDGDVWMIQQVQESGVPWLGWNTQHETIVNGPGANGATLALVDAQGPGEVAVFLNGSFGDLLGKRVVDTVGGPTSYEIPGNTHQHGNWVFTEHGEYALTFEISADGETDTATLHFAVGVEAGGGGGGAALVQADDPADETGEDAATEDESDESAQDEDSADEGDADEAATTGTTASGQPCTLPTTGGAPSDADGMALAGAALLAAGLLAVTYGRMRRRQHA